MVNTVSQSALRTLIGTQTASPQSSLAVLKGNVPAQKAVFESFRVDEKKSPDLSAALVSCGGRTNVPRGSLVDLLV